jgi:muconolactone delta-isomerase
VPEFLVSMDITFPAGMPLGEIRALLAEEAQAAKPYLDSGEFARAWRTYGEHEGSHGHMALWDVPDRFYLLDAYLGFPLVHKGYTANLRFQPLMVNPNDPETLPGLPVRLTFAELRRWLDEHGSASSVAGEGTSAEIAPGVSIHDHPHSGRPRELHFMVGGQKIAEIGPETESLQSENVAPGYIDFLAEWEGKPVHHEAWKQRILRDNGLVHDSYQDAVSAPRVRREVK